MGGTERAAETGSSLYLPKPALLAGASGAAEHKSCLNAPKMLSSFLDLLGSY